MKLRIAVLISLSVFAVGPVWAQDTVQVSDAERQWLGRIYANVSTQYSKFSQQAKPGIAILNKPGEINFYYEPQTHRVLVTILAVKVFAAKDGEVAFFLGHELGHSLVAKEPAQSAKLLAFLRSLYYIGAKDEMSRKAPMSKKESESLPDMWGLCLMSAAGYNPTDPAAGMGRMAVITGTSYEWAAGGQILNRWLNEHPADQRRISLLYRAIQAGLHKRCQQIR
jgi:predicted Zn-dependent protease